MKNLKINEEQSVRKKQRNNIRKNIMRAFVILLSLAIISLLVIPHIIMDDIVNQHVDFKDIYSAADFGLTSDKIALLTEDGLKIIAHEVSINQPKAMVIFLSGIHNPSVTAFFGHAKMLKENGYGSILLEMRAHGESEGDLICLGYKEYLDTKAVVDYIGDKYKNTPIIVYGLSMGAATAINSIGEIDEIDGLISMSAYSAWEDAFYDNMIFMGAPKIYASIQRPFVQIYLAVRYGLKSFNIKPKNEIKKLGDRPALIIHSNQDSQVPFQSFDRIMKNAPDHVESWAREGDLHFIVQDENTFFNPTNDKEYSDRILAFLNKNFNK
ncbi:MAG: lysophospholipase [Hyphomicrobiales bacterium]|nr:lysophospholipase [Hyphomicrobiales bacterium]